MRLASSPPTDCVVGDRLVEVGEQPARAVEQRAAGHRQLDAVRRAAQQLAADEPLERADLAAERRLGEVQPRRRAAEVELLGDRDERAQVPELDAVGRLREGKHLSAHRRASMPPRSRPVMRIVHDRHAGSAFPFLRTAASTSMAGVLDRARRGRSPPRWSATATSCTGTACGSLGSPADAEDALQETLLRAWRARRTLPPARRAAWLYRIATNACFDILARGDAGARVARRRAGARPRAERAARKRSLVARETVELALLTAIRHLPPRQHASLVMRDVLALVAPTTPRPRCRRSVPATNSALQRARGGLRAPPRPGPPRLGLDRAVRAQRRTLDRYLSAIDAPSAETAARLLTDAISPAAAASSRPS